MEVVGIIFGAIGILCFGIAIWLFIQMKNERIRYLELQTKENKGPNVVVIGGGTGQSIFLRGLKHHTENITAIVTVADDGGGSGVLRSDLGMLPPGDIRNCIMALANIEPTMNEVMQYRFEDGALKGQSFGNLFLAAMNGLYGNFETAVYKIGQIFAITGRVLPVTLENIDLIATLENSQVVKGESTIPKEVRKQKCKIDKITLIPEKCRPLDEVISSIHGADIIVMGPGSLYTSVIPNLLVPGVIDAIKKYKWALKGPTATPVGTGFRSVNVALRQQFATYANVRPIKSFKGINPLCEPRALLSLRENTALRRPYYRERHSQSRCRMYGPLLFSCRTRYR